MFPTKLDASNFVSGSREDRLSFAQHLVEGLNEHGVVIITNHGIPTRAIKDLFRLAEEFFKLPNQVKVACAHPGGTSPLRGYSDYGQEKSWTISPGNQHLQDAKDARESFDMGPLKAIRYPNNWPSEESLPGFRQRTESYYTSFHDVGKYLLEAIALGLGIAQGSILSRAEPNAAELRINHYPPISTQELTKTNTRRIWPHTDLGILTLLVQDSVGGLEFEDRRSPLGGFLPVSDDSQADVLVNVSDMLERWTNGLLKAGLHQVSAPKDRAYENAEESLVPSRYSAVFSYRPGPEMSAGPMVEFVDDAHPNLFLEMTASEFLKEKNRALYG